MVAQESNSVQKGVQAVRTRYMKCHIQRQEPKHTVFFIPPRCPRCTPLSTPLPFNETKHTAFTQLPRECAILFCRAMREQGTRTRSYDLPEGASSSTQKMREKSDSGVLRECQKLPEFIFSLAADACAPRSTDSLVIRRRYLRCLVIITLVLLSDVRCLLLPRRATPVRPPDQRYFGWSRQQAARHARPVPPYQALLLLHAAYQTTPPRRRIIPASTVIRRQRASMRLRARAPAYGQRRRPTRAARPPMRYLCYIVPRASHPTRELRDDVARRCYSFISSADFHASQPVQHVVQCQNHVTSRA